MTRLLEARRSSSSPAGRVDAALGRVPTYRLVAWCLTGLALVSVLAAAVGWLDFPVLALVGDLAAAVGASWVTSRLLGHLRHVRPHDPSAVITGLLVSFLVIPPDSPAGLLGPAAAGAVGAASTFFLRVRGRHVLNPAAFGAFALGLTGLTGSIWWVATGVMLPFVVVAAALVVVRTRSASFVLAFLAVAVTLDVVGQVRFATPPTEALTTAIVSTPLLFLGGFMLTEPLTLPPARWQRVAEAVLVGVAVAVPYLAPFAIGTLVPTPEAALLLGNLLSLAAARPTAARMRLTQRRALTATTTEFTLEADRPLRHRAGQYVELQVDHDRADRRGIRRIFTVASAPAEDGRIRVALRTREPLSSFKAALCTLPPGSSVRVVAVNGSFTLPRDRSLPVLLVASGIGITPFVSHLLEEARAAGAGAPARDIRLVYRVANVDDVPYADELAALGVRTLLVAPGARPHGNGPRGSWCGVTDLDAAAVEAFVPHASARRAYVSGSPAFAGHARAVLRRAGVRHVRTDAFAGY